MHQGPLDEGTVVEKIEAQYGATSSILVNGLSTMNDFREEIKKDLHYLNETALAIRSKFKQFDEDPKNQLNGHKLLIKGEGYYQKLLTVETSAILEGLNEDIEVWDKNLKYLMNEKAQKIEKINSTLDSLLYEGITFFKTFKPAATKRLNVFESAKHMRKLEAFGQADAPVDF